jgi:hypothetical protein
VLPGAQGGDGKTAQQHLAALASAASQVAAAAKTKPAQAKPGATAPSGTTPGTPAAALAQARAAYSAAEKLVLADIAANACVALGSGCFAAGTKLLTARGWVAVEHLVVGDQVAARDQFADPVTGSVEWKPVEATFKRLGRVLHLHFPDGELIRTTPEHPFGVAGKGWTAAGALTAGDRIATLSGEWVAVGEVFDTQEWEPVFNVRVADHHTYFVGCAVEERAGCRAVPRPRPG